MTTNTKELIDLIHKAQEQLKAMEEQINRLELINTGLVSLNTHKPTLKIVR